ncbi:hypothetical protein Rhopal_006367-T1 [Rhodotorula paludigena]|uniref:MFS general substrate transporter n=1 Tax=Rhodotorula paludigena TaxID=86838 RepID=A0AAV5GL21_9BASI|nr:hypothetical protein Rhopal_006367-T1 [Rhodotorula paludigena]
MSCSSQEDYKEQLPTALEAAVGKAPSEDALDFEERFAAIDRKRLMRRVDLRIIPYICLTYMVVRLDLGNVANSGTTNSEAGHSLKQVLSLDAKQWAWVISCFYYPYMFSEPVCTFFVKLTSPSVWLTRIMVSWGAVMACMAAVTNYGGLITCRVLLGLFEGSYFTSVIYHWSFWYTPDEMAPRVLFLYVANSSVLFIVEGLLTVTLGIGMYFILPNWPSEYIVAHRHRNAPKTTDKTWVTSEILLMFADPTFWFFSLFWACYAVGAWGISTVLPFVVLDLGISDSAGTQLLQIPPATTGVLMCCLSAYLIRKRNVSAFLCTLGPPSAYACLWPRRVAALRGSSAAALGIGINNAISQLSGLVGPSLWRSDYGPRYINSAKGACGLVAADFCIVLALWWLMEGDLTRHPWLQRRVLAQTQVSEADVEAEKRGETIARGRA